MNSNIDLEKIGDIRKVVESNSSVIDNIVNDIISSYCSELDAYVRFVSNCLKDADRDPNAMITSDELDHMCMNLSTQIYFAGGFCERLGIRDDIAKAMYNEVYHKARSEQPNGTVADKNSFAELASTQEQITSICYTRAYKIVRAKVDSAQELLASCKKVLTRRISELELTHMQNQ